MPEQEHNAEDSAARPAETGTLAEELARMPEEPLLPVEKKLIAYSLALGVFLLIALAWLSATFFKA